MVFYATFNNISVLSRRKLTLFMYFLDFTSTCPRTLPRKTQRIQCSSNPGPLTYESNTLLTSHKGLYPHSKKYCMKLGTMKMSSTNVFNLDRAKIMSSDKGLTLYKTIPTLNNLKNRRLLKTENVGNHFCPYNDYFF